MLKPDLEKYEELLLNKRTELERSVRQREGLAIEKSPDLVDEVQSAAERELVVLSRDLESVLLREVRSALDRIRDGSFGHCLSCDEPISRRRLEAVPWACHCLRCQEVIDQENGRTVGPGAGRTEAADEILLPRAA
jgi:RNA polymerase-binding transcription factor